MKIMKHFSFFALMILVISISACGSGQSLGPTLTATKTPTLTPANTSTPTPTNTPVPTATSTPVPLGGGGTFIMKVSPNQVPIWFSSQGTMIWYSASSDGSNIKKLGLQIWSISPDGKHILTYPDNNKCYQNEVSLSNLDGIDAIPLDNSIDYYVCYETTAMWLPNGTVIVLGYENKQHTKRSIFIVNPDGSLKKWEKPSFVMNDPVSLLFITPDGKNLIWENDTLVNNYVTFSGVYISSLDDSVQKRILPNLGAIQDLFVSPSGQYIMYSDISGFRFNGTYVYKIADGTSTKIPADMSIASDGISHWSPTEDKLWGTTKDGYAILTLPDGTMNEIATYSDVGYCFPGWTPDGKTLFLNDCVDTSVKFQDLTNMKYFFKSYPDLTFNESLGQELIDISNGKVTKYPDTGFCDSAISPDSQWALLFACKNEKDLVVYPSQMLNLNTKEMVPLFKDFIADSNVTLTQPQGVTVQNKVWSVFWMP
jgi:hypothetical protein